MSKASEGQFSMGSHLRTDTAQRFSHRSALFTRSPEGIRNSGFLVTRHGMNSVSMGCDRRERIKWREAK